MESTRQNPYQEEQAKLTHILQAVNTQLNKLQTIPRYYGDDLVEQVLDEIREKQRHNLVISKEQPFFGRLDFQEQANSQVTPLYIGKVGVKDGQTEDVLVTDWRAPISSMFYSFTGASDEAAYESPDGLVEGVVHLKRNISIRNKLLERVVDSYVRGSDNLGVTDEYLLYRLEEKKDNRLRDIVSTIQAEQDHIIRADKNMALIIQGVAGSGKTTVALHRIAYMLYQYQDKLKSEKMIIFAPNRMFLDYISNVLPELGVGGIQQTTFVDWALDYLPDEVRLSDPTDRISRWFDPTRVAQPNWVNVIRYKGSIDFLDAIHTFLQDYEQTLVPTGDFEAWEGQVLSEETIRAWFTTEYRHYPLHPRRDRVFARIHRWLEIAVKEYASHGLPKDFKKKATQRLKSYMKKWPQHTPLSLYTELLKRNPLTQAQGQAKLKVIELEDVAPLVYIHDQLQGIPQDGMFDHVVIDEAQDFCPFQIAVLQHHCPSQSFTILGDLSQNIYSFQGIQRWEEFMDMFERENTGFFQLTRSYRSTMEIIEFANEVLKRSGEDLTYAEPVFRSGAKVQMTKVGSADSQRIDTIASVVKRVQTQSVSTVAVVTRTDQEGVELQEALSSRGLDTNLVQTNQRNYRGGISVIPIHLTKGLEFDAVVLVDVDEAHYPQDAQHAKLLYVGCTRALHALWVLTSATPSSLIGDIHTDFYETSETSTTSL